MKFKTPSRTNQEVKKIQIINIKIEKVDVNSYPIDITKTANDLWSKLYAHDNLNQTEKSFGECKLIRLTEITKKQKPEKW